MKAILISILTLAFMSASAFASPTDCARTHGNWVNASTMTCDIASGTAPRDFTPADHCPKPTAS